MDVSKFNLFGVLFNFKDKKARDDHAALAETVGVHGEDIQGLQAPTFSEPAANANVREAVAKVKSGATLGTLFTNVKAALNGLITLGEMRNYLVNNGTVTETGKYFLDAAYGKTLLDQITALNSNSRLKIYQYTDYEGLDNSITRPLYFVRYGKIGLINFYIRYTTEYSLTLPSGTSFPFVQTLITPTLTKDSTSVLNVYVESNYMKFSGGKVGDRYLVNFVFLMI